MTQLHSDVFGHLLLEPFLPKNCTDNIMPGSSPFSYVGEAGQILIQQVVAEAFTFYFAEFAFTERTKITSRIDGFTIQSHIAIAEELNAGIQGAGHFKIRPGHFILVQNSSQQASFIFEKGKKYFAFGSSYSPSFIFEYVKAFASFEKTIAKQRKKNALALTKSPIHGTREIMDTVYNILHCPDDFPWREKYIDNKIDSLLHLQLAAIYKEVPVKLPFNQAQVESIHEARRIILSDVGQHYSIKELAKKVHLNLYAFKTGFKLIYGTPPFEYLLEARLNHAKKLLQETNKPVKEIARIVGYARSSSFTHAFTRHFGYTPGTLRL